MAKQRNGQDSIEAISGITKVSVAGYKSISREQSIEIKPLTILAGANSSGKSSIMQPLLLLKQTLEISYDPGALLIDGPNLRFTEASQFLSRDVNNTQASDFDVNLAIGNIYCKLAFTYKKEFQIERMGLEWPNEHITLSPGLLPKGTNEALLSGLGVVSLDFYNGFDLQVFSRRCFLDLSIVVPEGQDWSSFGSQPNSPATALGNLTLHFKSAIQKIIHVPSGLAKAERLYGLAVGGPIYQGTFDNYVGAVLAGWQNNGDSQKIKALEQNLSLMGLARRIEAKRLNDAQIDLRVNRQPHLSNGKADMVSASDVGSAVAQSLPVLVALHAAEPGQLVYLEEPEIHLHPRAQTALAEVLADAAKRGVRVVAETHSSLLLLGIQTLVAEGKLAPDLVKLHWFTRRDDGSTEISSSDLDETGAFGDWPVDFADVELNAESNYLDAAEQQLAKR